uniref:Uncharacterized protein n=1 Tax=Arundo donax TaxID=35708 RepID=A0A0A9BH50_ARUDO
MRRCHDVDTHWDRANDLHGSLVRISVSTSSLISSAISDLPKTTVLHR